MANILNELGFYQYCVSFTLVDNNNRYLGMFSTVCWATSEHKAISKIAKKFDCLNVNFVGKWDVKIEQI